MESLYTDNDIGRKANEVAEKLLARGLSKSHSVVESLLLISVGMDDLKTWVKEEQEQRNPEAGKETTS